MLSKLLPEPLGFSRGPGFLGQGERGHGVYLADDLVLSAMLVDAAGFSAGILLVRLHPG